MKTPCKKQTILSRNYLTKAVEASYSEIGLNFVVPEEEEQRIIQALSRIRNGVIQAIEAAVPGAVGKESELARVCGAVEGALQEGFARAAQDFHLDQARIQYLQEKVFEQRDKVKAEIESQFDLEKEEKSLGPGVDYMTCLDEALLQFMVYLMNRIDGVYEKMGAYLCGKCAKIHIHAKTKDDGDFVTALEQFGADATRRIMDDIKDYQYRKKPFTFDDLRRCFHAFMAKRRGSLKISYRLKGKGLENLRTFVFSLFQEIEHLQEDDFLRAEIPKAFSGYHGNTRAFYRKRVLDGMSERGLTNLCPVQIQEEGASGDTDEVQVQPAVIADTALADEEQTSITAQVSEGIPVQAAQADIPAVVSKSPDDSFVQVKELYLENPEFFVRKLALFLCEPFYAVAFDKGMYVCDHCKAPHVNDESMSRTLQEVENYVWKTVQGLSCLVAPFVQSDPAKVDFDELREKIVDFSQKRLDNYRANAPNMRSEAKGLKEQYLIDLLIRVRETTVQSFSTYGFNPQMTELFNVFRVYSDEWSGSNLTPCSAGRWRDFVAEKKKEGVPEQPSDSGVAAVAEDLPQNVQSPDEAPGADNTAADTPRTSDPAKEIASADAGTKGSSSPSRQPSSRPPSAPPPLSNRDSSHPGRISEIDDARMKSVLDWALGLPEMQKKNYMRYEIKALVQILSQAQAHPKSLVVYAVLKLEKMRESFSFEDDNKSVNTRMGSDEILQTFVEIFEQLRFERPSKSEAAALVQTRLSEFGNVIDELEREYLVYEGKLNINDISYEQQKSSLLAECALLTGERTGAEQKRAALKAEMVGLLKSDLFAAMKENNAEAARLKVRLDDIATRLQVIAEELETLEKANVEYQRIIAKLVDIKAKLASAHERRREFTRSVRSLLEQHRQQTQSQSS